MGATHHHGQTLVNLLRQAELGAPPREDVDGVGGLLGAEAAQGGRHGGVRGQLQLCWAAGLLLATGWPSGQRCTHCTVHTRHPAPHYNVLDVDMQILVDK